MYLLSLSLCHSLSHTQNTQNTHTHITHTQYTHTTHTLHTHTHTQEKPVPGIASAKQQVLHTHIERTHSIPGHQGASAKQQVLHFHRAAFGATFSHLPPSSLPTVLASLFAPPPETHIIHTDTHIGLCVCTYRARAWVGGWERETHTHTHT